MATPPQRFAAYAEALLGAPASQAQLTKLGDSIAYSRGYSAQYALLSSSDKALWALTEMYRERKIAIKTMTGNLASVAAQAPIDQEFP